MRCPSCASETTVLESRKRETGTYRRRLCEACGSRFSTMETVIQEKRGPKPKADVSKKPAKTDTSRPRVDAKNTKPKPAPRQRLEDVWMRNAEQHSYQDDLQEAGIDIPNFD